ILAQSSDGLAYLHTLDPQVVHRDVRPSYVLIPYCRPDDIFIEFADFGVSRAEDSLKSICDTSLYKAPELYKANSILCLRPDARTTATDYFQKALLLLDRTQESNSEASGGRCSDSFTSTGRGVRSCNDPPPKATAVHVRQLLSKFRNPKDSLFYDSSFGEDSDGSYGDGGGSGSASTIVIIQDIKPQNEEVKGSPGSILGFTAPSETDDIEDMPSENSLRVLRTNAVKHMAQETETCSGNKANAALSFKRSRTT
ncbi:MAG: hypothetical protein Q9210_007596, partial [Variospora velana]